MGWSISTSRQFKTAAAAAGLSLSQIAREAGISSAHLSNVLSGRDRPSKELRDRLGRVLLAHLLSESEAA